MTAPETTILLAMRGGSGLRELARVCARATGVSTFAEVGPCGPGEALAATQDGDDVHRFTALPGDEAALNGIYDLWSQAPNITIVRPPAVSLFYQWLRESNRRALLVDASFTVRAGVVAPAVIPCVKQAEEHARMLQTLLAPHEPPVIIVNDTCPAGHRDGPERGGREAVPQGSAFRMTRVPVCRGRIATRCIADGASLAETALAEPRRSPAVGDGRDREALLSWVRTAVAKLRPVMPGRVDRHVVPAKDDAAHLRVKARARADRAEAQWDRVTRLLWDPDTWRGGFSKARRYFQAR